MLAILQRSRSVVSGTRDDMADEQPGGGAEEEQNRRALGVRKSIREVRLEQTLLYDPKNRSFSHCRADRIYNFDDGLLDHEEECK